MSSCIEIDMDSEKYPKNLCTIRKPPAKLYCAGNISLLNSRCAAIVGSRKYTMYGKMTALMIAERLVKSGVTVVSGMATGIDTFAHRGALDAGGNTIAVLGSGLDHPFPVSNTNLMNEIIREGLVISEYPPETYAAKYTFPQRNRIISGLSEAVIVVEAGANSGSLITANLAVEQGRSLYAVPGNINSQFSFGTNLLIRDGAVPLVVIDDVLNDMGIDTVAEACEEIELDEDERKIVNLIAAADGITADEIAYALGKRLASVNSMLTVLEIKGVVFSYAGKIFLAKSFF